MDKHVWKKRQVPILFNCHMTPTEKAEAKRGPGPGGRTLGLSVGQHSLCPLHVSLQQLGASNLTGLLGRGHCGHFRLGTGDGAAGHAGVLRGQVRGGHPSHGDGSRVHNASRGDGDLCLLPVREEFPKRDPR